MPITLPNTDWFHNSFIGRLRSVFIITWYQSSYASPSTSQYYLLTLRAQNRHGIELSEANCHAKFSRSKVQKTAANKNVLDVPLLSRLTVIFTFRQYSRLAADSDSKITRMTLFSRRISKTRHKTGRNSILWDRSQRLFSRVPTKASHQLWQLIAYYSLYARNTTSEVRWMKLSTRSRDRLLFGSAEAADNNGISACGAQSDTGSKPFFQRPVDIEPASIRIGDLHCDGRTDGRRGEQRSL